MQSQSEMVFAPTSFMLLFVVVLPIVLLLTLLPYWFICKKAGYHPALSLLILIPFGGIILPFFLAFANWPVLRKAA